MHYNNEIWKKIINKKKQERKEKKKKQIVVSVGLLQLSMLQYSADKSLSKKIGPTVLIST